MNAKQHDEATARMLASFAKQRQQHWEENMRKANSPRTFAEVDAEMLRDFDATEAAAINSGVV